jgi:SWIM zinc finger
MDPDRLTRGRSYVRGNRVSDLEIMPGTIDALVRGSRARPFAVTVSIPVFNDSGWAKLLDEVAAEVGRLAAILDGELPPGLAAGLDLRPGPGELHTSCACPDWADQPCEHAAAVCYQTADALDADPFALLLLRGRPKDEVLAALRDRRQPAWSGPAGMLARDAYRRALAPLPAPALPPRRPGPPARLSAEPPVASGVSTAELAELATIATRLAWELLCGPASGPASGPAQT